MEQSKKPIAHELGTIYGAALSQNGKWLNVKVMTSHNGETISVCACVPVVGIEEAEGKKARSDGSVIDGYYVVGVKKFPESKEAPKTIEVTADDLPF